MHGDDLDPIFDNDLREDFHDSRAVLCYSAESVSMPGDDLPVLWTLKEQ